MSEPTHEELLRDPEYAAWYANTFAGQKEALDKAVAQLFWPFRVWMERKMRKLELRMDALRDESLRRWFHDTR